MVYESKTFEPCHDLTAEGWLNYSTLLEAEGDEILFKHKHPIRYWTQRLLNWIRLGDSTWLGPNYAEEEKYKDGFSYTGHQG